MAADRELVPRSVVEQPKLPPLFQEIIDNDAERAAIRAKGGAMTQADWCRLGSLTERKKRDLRPAAERALSWNTDKGKTG